MGHLVSLVCWDKTHRFINSHYPTIDLFEDVAAPEDWELLCQAEAKTNPRILDSIGNLALIPVNRRVSGSGASYVIAPFTHANPDRAGRFHDGNFGVYYGANSFETALFETIHHTAQFCRATNEKKGWIADMRELVGSLNTKLVDIRGQGFETLLITDDYRASQAFARQVKENGDHGIVYPSVRHESGQCFAAFYPDVMTIPLQGEHISYHWNGERVDMVKFLTGDQKGEVFRIQE